MFELHKMISRFDYFFKSEAKMYPVLPAYVNLTQLPTSTPLTFLLAGNEPITLPFGVLLTLTVLLV